MVISPCDKWRKSHFSTWTYPLEHVGVRFQEPCHFDGAIVNRENDKGTNMEVSLDLMNGRRNCGVLAMDLKP